MGFYRMEVKIRGTAYIKAASEEEAVEKAKYLEDEGLDVEGCGDKMISALLQISPTTWLMLSPVMKICPPLVRPGGAGGGMTMVPKDRTRNGRSIKTLRSFTTATYY